MPTNNGSTFFRGDNTVKVSQSFEKDEWGNVIKTETWVFKGNVVESIVSPSGQDSMSSDSEREILSRSMTFDEVTQTTTLEQRTIKSYALPSKKRMSIDANSGTESVTAHPRFQQLAGTPDDPNEENAVWVASSDAVGTKRFVEFKKPSLYGVSSYIAGNGSTLRLVYFDSWSGFGSVSNKIGRIDFPDVPGLWGTTTGWLLAGATAEPFGNKWKVSLLYRNASENFGQYDGGGWSSQIYA